MSTNPYIGAHITLLSKAEIRYEGILFSIDMEGATITLENGRYRHILKFSYVYHRVEIIIY